MCESLKQLESNWLWNLGDSQCDPIWGQRSLGDANSRADFCWVLNVERIQVSSERGYRDFMIRKQCEQGLTEKHLEGDRESGEGGMRRGQWCAIVCKAPACHAGILYGCQFRFQLLHLIQLTPNRLGKAMENGSKVCTPTFFVGDVKAFWEANQQMEDLFVAPFLSL